MLFLLTPRHSLFPSSFNSSFWCLEIIHRWAENNSCFSTVSRVFWATFASSANTKKTLLNKPLHSTLINLLHTWKQIYTVLIWTSTSVMQDTCFKENLPDPLFQTSNFLQKLSHSKAPTQGHANANPSKLKITTQKSSLWWWLCATNEPWHDKTNKKSVRPAKTQISLGIRPVW